MLLCQVMVNSERNITKVLQFLGRFQVVVTSSYHGALWAMYLGKRVIFYQKLTAKLDLMRYKHTMATSANKRLLFRDVQTAAAASR